MVKANTKKILFYVSISVVACIATTIICGFATGEGWFYSVCWGILAAIVAGTVTRIAFHLVFKDNRPEMWQVSIYMFGIALGWMIAIIGTSWAVSSIGLAMCVGFVLMAFGTRLIKQKGDWIQYAAGLGREELEKSLRWKYLDDDPKLGEDYSRALCAVNGTPLTIAEAISQGYVSTAKEAKEYLDSVLKEDD